MVVSGMRSAPQAEKTCFKQFDANQDGHGDEGQGDGRIKPVQTDGGADGCQYPDDGGGGDTDNRPFVRAAFGHNHASADEADAGDHLGQNP